MRSMRILPALVIVSLLAGCAAPVVQPPRPGELTFEPLEFRVPQVEPVELDNGIRVYLLEDTELPLIEMTAMVGAGSIADPADRDGRGALFAGLLGDGGAGERGPAEFEAYLESLAIDLSVATGPYVTTIDLSLLREDLDNGLAILDDLLRRPRFDAGRLELLRRQTLEGIRRRNDDPGSIASRALDRAVFGDHPFGRVSTLESVSAISRADLVGFHRDYFVPNNLWLAISGDFDREAMLAKLRRLFDDWPETGFTPQEVPPLGDGLEPAVRVAGKDVPQTTIRIGHVGISKDNPDLHAVRVMNFILGGGGFNSRLLREIRSNRGLAYSAYSYFDIGRKLPGAFIAGSETKSASTVEVVRLMLQEIDRIRTEPVGREELELAKESRINSFVFAFTDSHQILTRQVRLDYFDYPDNYMQDYRDNIATVTADDVLRVAREYLRPEELSIVLVGRPGEFEMSPATLGRPVETIELTEHGLEMKE